MIHLKYLCYGLLTLSYIYIIFSHNYIKRLDFGVITLFVSHIAQIVIVEKRKHRKECKLCKYRCTSMRLCESRQLTRATLAWCSEVFVQDNETTDKTEPEPQSNQTSFCREHLHVRFNYIKRVKTIWSKFDMYIYIYIILKTLGI